MTRYEEARKKLEKAENECIAELFAECCLPGENPYVMDEFGNWMTREEVYQKLLRGDKR